MHTQKWIGWGCALAMLTAPVLGCQTYRHVVTLQNSDMLDGAPNWAKLNSQEPTEGDLYFVGVSQEQVTSEAEAVDQAYQDALKKASDYLAVRIEGRDEFGSTASTQTSADWPYRTSPHLGNTFFGFGGRKGAEFDRGSREHVLNERQVSIIRDNLLSYVNIVDTWSASERFGFANSADGIAHYNRMRHGELWKAKVLVVAPKEEMTKLASTIQNMRQRDFETQQREIDTDYHYRVRAAEMVPDRPTFNFMNNTLFFGQAQPVPFVSRVR